MFSDPEPCPGEGAVASAAAVVVQGPLVEGRMRCVIPEVAYHNRDPVLSIDFQVKLPTQFPA